MELNGKFGSAVVYTDSVEEDAKEQIVRLLDMPYAAGAKVRIMPDVHAGAGCVIGFTADLGDAAVPDLVGVDIGCGMLTVSLGRTCPDFSELDRVIRARIPAGREVREDVLEEFPFEELFCFRALRDRDRLKRSLGSLGGGNHFIEVEKSGEGEYFLVIHTGSRNLGKQVAEYYQARAVSLVHGKERLGKETDALIQKYRAEGRERELSGALRKLKRELRKDGVPDSLCHLTGREKEDYLHDMALCQRFAASNRAHIADLILGAFSRSLSDAKRFETVHNYIETETNLVRKGAVSAKAGERLLIPINMRDGSLLCVGKGNPDWNFSAPHGAGRAYGRRAARDRFTVEQFRAEMAGVFSTSVSEKTIDECPMAYKSMDDIVRFLSPTAEIEKILTPVYNFKAGE